MLTNRIRVLVLSLVIVPFMLSTPAVASEAADLMPSDALFQTRVAEYVALQRECARRLLEHGLDRDGSEGFPDALAESIRIARREARPGDLFLPTLSLRILQAVRTDFDELGVRERLTLFDEVPLVPAVTVNERYPDGAPMASMPPSLLRRLPPLPPELQYRFLGEALILLDGDARVIVDVLPYALPGTEID
jgi:hypothetical protein